MVDKTALQNADIPSSLPAESASGSRSHAFNDDSRSSARPVQTLVGNQPSLDKTRISQERQTAFRTPAEPTPGSNALNEGSIAKSSARPVAGDGTILDKARVHREVESAHLPETRLADVRRRIKEGAGIALLALAPEAELTIAAMAGVQAINAASYADMGAVRIQRDPTGLGHTAEIIGHQNDGIGIGRDTPSAEQAL